MVYYVIALAFYAEASMSEVLRCLLEGLRWLARPEQDVRVSGKSGISQARTRLGEEPVRALYRQVVGPIAQARTKGAWYRGWRLVSIDGILRWRLRNTRAGRSTVGKLRNMLLKVAVRVVTTCRRVVCHFPTKLPWADVWHAAARASGAALA